MEASIFILGVCDSILAGDEFFMYRQAVYGPPDQFAPPHSCLFYQPSNEPRVDRAQLNVKVHSFGHKGIIECALWSFCGISMVILWVENSFASEERRRQASCVCTMFSFVHKDTRVQLFPGTSPSSEKSSRKWGLASVTLVGRTVFALNLKQSYRSHTENPYHRDSFSFLPAPGYCRSWRRKSKADIYRSSSRYPNPGLPYSWTDLPAAWTAVPAASRQIDPSGFAQKAGPHA
jgi:hypothetical protein